ncbi:dethiobiotin synthetase [Modicisalibacter ilicicola DSM 19980]|uniref:ATP-dependent dethiobiotin synthetase BioD n=1 Tax=Modicisalibacter ilicicola DSM 19980 TaxID=1121942 RepID=A0A1M4WA20_9GAMM|nr:dethiobiotin synthase [Halomonas ilicicola]SHE78084.1 dethiobiotin synthetase [Halomonas ilicicola DSM 19980]
MTTFFVTGTNTDVGKTLVSCALLARARARGFTTLGLKPVASGSEVTSQGLRNADALALQAHCSPRASYAEINPYRFVPAIAPHLAARQAGCELTLEALATCLAPTLAEPYELVLVEGAGGWRVPLNDSEDLAGLAVRLELPVILVVGLELGCLNQARLTAEAIRSDGLRLAGWVGSLLDPGFAVDEIAYRDNLATLEHHLPGPCLGILPRLEAESPEALAHVAATYLRLSCLSIEAPS